MSHHSVDVLIIEDDSAVEYALQTRLQQSGAHVRSVRNGNHALQEVRHRVPELIILDCGLPGRDGLKVARMIRSGVQHEHVEVIAFTGRTDEATRAAFLSYGIPLVVKAPGAWAELLRQMHALLGWPEESSAEDSDVALPQELAC